MTQAPKGKSCAGTGSLHGVCTGHPELPTTHSAFITSPQTRGCPEDGMKETGGRTAKSLRTNAARVPAEPPAPFPQCPLTGAHLLSGSNLDALCGDSFALYCMTATTPSCPGPAFQSPSDQQPTFGAAGACSGIPLPGIMKNFLRGHEGRSVHENMGRNCVDRAIPWPARPRYHGMLHPPHVVSWGPLAGTD